MPMPIVARLCCVMLEIQLLLTTHYMLKNRDQGKLLDVAILDFLKAFDTVPHRRRLGKL